MIFPLDAASAVPNGAVFLPPGLFPLCGGSYEGLWEILYAHGGYAGLLVRRPDPLRFHRHPDRSRVPDHFLGVSADLVLKLRGLFRVPGAHGLEKAVMEERKKETISSVYGGA